MEETNKPSPIPQTNDIKVDQLSKAVENLQSMMDKIPAMKSNTVPDTNAPASAETSNLVEEVRATEPEVQETTTKVPKKIPKQVEKLVTSINKIQTDHLPIAPTEQLADTEIMKRISNMPEAVSSRLGEKQIDFILEMAKKEADRSYKESTSNKIFRLIYFLIAIAAVFAIFYYLIDQGVLTEILTLFFAFAGGFGIGYAVKTYLDKKPVG